MSTVQIQRHAVPASPFVTAEDYRRIIVEGDAATLVKCADAIGTTLAPSLPTAQIRSIFGTVRQIEAEWDPRGTAHQQALAARQLLLLKPKLAYQAKRQQRDRGVADLEKVLVPAIDLVQGNHDYFRHFVDFFEAILAYHTAKVESRGGGR